jgi:enterochelin esterase-like enzyme
MRWTLGLVGAVIGAGLASIATAAPAGHPILEVNVSPAVSAPKGGRLLVFAEPIAAAEAKAKGGPLRPVNIQNVAEPGQAVAAAEVERATPGAHLAIDLDQTAFPEGFSHLPPGEYAVQAVLDVHHTYNYGGRVAGDLLSPVVRLRLPLDASAPALTLDKVLPAVDYWKAPWLSPKAAAVRAAVKPHATAIAFESRALSAFWGRSVTMRGWVVTPPGYDPKGKATYPTVYSFHGFGADEDTLLTRAGDAYAAMAAGRTPPMVWVFLDHSGPWGANEFADSVNNGPWGRALAEELIPDLERHYRMDSRPNGRFLSGHSSGGWASLWMQTRYPKMFGGTWSTSPDPSDFHDFLGSNLYADHANIYVAPGGGRQPMFRDGGKVLASMEEFARLEAVMGPSGGQMASFDWVFSPRGPDGRAVPMFDRATGAVDPAVLAYWHDHYDIAHLIAANWRTLKADLDGKIHVAVGGADSFYLDGAAHRLQGVLDGLGAKSRFDFVPGRGHFDLLVVGDNPNGRLETYAWEMYAVARRGSHPPALSASPATS